MTGKASQPCPPGAFCSNCIRSDWPLFFEYGWNADNVPVPICTRGSTQHASPESTPTEVDLVALRRHVTWMKRLVARIRGAA